MTWPHPSKIGWAALLVGAALLFCTPQTAKADDAGHSRPLDDCLNHVIDNEHSSRWPAVVFCYDNELNAQERRLDEAWSALDTAARRKAPALQEQIATTRRQWTAWRDGWCAIEQDYAPAPNASVARLSCRIDLTKAQAGRVAEMAAALR